MQEMEVAACNHSLDFRTHFILREVHCIHDVQQTIIGRGPCMTRMTSDLFRQQQHVQTGYYRLVAAGASIITIG